jgi:hypothetical protein
MGCLLGVALGCFFWFVWVWVLLVSLSLFWVHLGVLSYTFLYNWVAPPKLALFDINFSDLSKKKYFTLLI